MKKMLLPALMSMFIVLCGCTYGLHLSEEITTRSDGEEYSSSLSLQTESVSEITSETETSAIAPETTKALSEETSVNEEELTSLTEEPETEVNTLTVTQSQASTEPATEKEEHSTANELPVTDVDLSIEMPEKNGTMETDSSPDNRLIRIVCSERGIDAELLAAVYAVPESGQNYVFEFYTADKRTADSIRRVFLINEKGKITSVAAVKADEKENISSVENWFCMNVLIKEVIYPAIAEELAG